MDQKAQKEREELKKAIKEEDIGEDKERENQAEQDEAADSPDRKAPEAAEPEEAEPLEEVELQPEETDSGTAEEEEGWEEDWEEQPKSWKTALVFLGLMVLAAVICAALWHVSHPEEKESDIQQTQAADPSGPSEEEEPSGSVTPKPDTDVSGTGEEPGGGEEAGSSGGTGDPEDPIQEPISGTADMVFTPRQESVTPKDVINLRSVPTTLDTENVVKQVLNGEVLTRTGINEDTGWSEIEYEGRKVYAVSQYLTTDLDYKPPVEAANPNRVSTIDGRVIIFADCNDWITPKEYVNLRTEPSTSEGETTVSCQLNYGERTHRTGISPDSGWSRVEYNGQVLYVVTSLMNVVQEEASGENGEN